MLPTIWFVLWGLLWAIYFSLDGFDMGAGMLTALLGSDEEVTLLIHSLGPFWDGNEVWLVTAGGVTFAAFPALYAVMFSSLYAPLMIILAALILRAVSIEFYHFKPEASWRRTWVRVLAGGSLVATLFFGVAFGNIFLGLPIDQAGYHGTLLGLLNPYGLLTGLLFAVAFLYNGSAWLAFKATDATLRAKGLTIGSRTWPVLLAAAVLFIGCTPFATKLADNYGRHPALLILPLAAVGCLVITRLMLGKGHAGRALLTGSTAVLTTVMSGIAGLYPNMFPSRIDPTATLTAFNASSTPQTLKIMLIVTAVFLPLVLVYQVWFYKLFIQPDTDEESGY